ARDQVRYRQLDVFRIGAALQNDLAADRVGAREAGRYEIRVHDQSQVLRVAEGDVATRDRDAEIPEREALQREASRRVHVASPGPGPGFDLSPRPPERDASVDVVEDLSQRGHPVLGVFQPDGAGEHGRL